MRKILLSLILIIGFAGRAIAAEKVSPYLSGVNVMYTERERVEKVISHKDTMSQVTRMGIFEIIRFPGGLLSDQYHWMSGVGVAEKNAEIGTKRFAEICEAIGAEKMVTVNFKTGTPAEAANWVEFANGAAPKNIPADWEKVPYAYNHEAPEGYFAYLRGSMERKEPYAVKFWEIGNEIDWWNRIDAGSYAREAVEFAKAMRAKDKNILIGACASPMNDEWNKELLKIAGRHIDFIIIHIYGGPDKSYPDKAEEYRVLFSKLDVVEQRIGAIKQLTKKYAPRCKIAVTEGNTSYNEFKLGADELKKWKSALWIAGLKNVLMRQGVMAYCHWNLADGGAYGVVSDDGSVTPTYEVLKLYAENTGTELARIGANYKQINGNKLDCVATVDGKKTRIMVVNTGQEPIEAQIYVDGFKAADKGAVKVLKAGDDLCLESRSVKIEDGECVVEGGNIIYKFEPESVTAMEMGK